jgi:hypothetical protein
MPITPWFGHDDVLALVRKRIEGFLEGFRQNCALLGPAGVGKSTLLKRLLHQESRTPRFFGIYVALQEESNVAEWAQRFVQAIFYSVLQQRGISELPSSLTQLLQMGRVFLPRTASQAERLLSLSQDPARTEELYDRPWDLPHLATQETGDPCLLVLDEFDRLTKLNVKDPFDRLGRKIMVQGTTMYLVASSQEARAREILRSGLRLLFGQFETIEMASLHPADCLQAIRSIWPKGILTPFAEHLLIELSQGYPAWLDLLLQGLLDRGLGEESQPQERVLLDVLEELSLEAGGALRSQCEGRLRTLPPRHNRLIWLETLGAVASGAHRVAQIASRLDRPSAQVLRALCFLEEKDLVVKRGAFYGFSDRLFQLWMLAAFPVLQGVGLFDPLQGRARFRDTAWVWMEGFREAMQQPFEKYVSQFLRQWQGERVEIEGRRLHLPSCARVEERPAPWGRKLLMASPAGGRDRPWLVIPWMGLLEESDARQLAQEISGPLWRGSKKLLVGAYPVELHARLILQETRIRLWDLQILNDVLELYGLYRIPYPDAPRVQGAQTVTEFLPRVEYAHLPRKEELGA